MGSLFIAIAMVFAALVYSTRASVVSSEMRAAEAEAARLVVTVEHEYKALDTFALDWGEWDDTYEFVSGRYPGFIERNIDDEWFGRAEIDFAVFFDNAGMPQLVWSGGLMKTENGVSETDLTNALHAESLLAVSEANRNRHGVIMLGDTPLLVSSHAILTSTAEGPSAGAAVFGRVLDVSAIRKLSGVGTGPISVYALDSKSLPADVLSALDNLGARRRTYVHLTRPHTLTAYALLRGPSERPTGIARAELESVGYRGTPQLVGGIIGALLLLGLVWSHSTFRLVERASLSRMTWLKSAVSLLGASRDGRLRIDIDSPVREDEISEVAEEINLMLDALEESRRAQTESEQRNIALVENMADAVFVLGLDGFITFASPRAEDLTGVAAADVVGASYERLITTDSHELVAQLLSSPAVLGSRRILEVNFTHRDLGSVPVELSISPVHDAEGALHAIQWIARDVAERKRFEQQLMHMANHDHLTGLFNRRRLEEELARHLGTARRLGTSGSLLWIDLDGFKEINDAYGHSVGDELLVMIAETIRRTNRSNQVVSRLGGDEFSVLLPNANAADAHNVATRLLQQIRGCVIPHEGRDIRVTASIGIATFPDQGTSVEELLSRADIAMYHAKQEGRNRVSVYTLDHDREAQLTERHGWAARIEFALAEDNLLACAQPIVDVMTGKIASYEMLVRMKEDGQVVPPAEFLAHAETLGLINQVDEWMLTEAISVLQDCESAGMDVSLAVNLSGNAFCSQTALAHIKHQVEESGVNPRRIGFEITETALIRNIGHATHFVSEMRDIGCFFALDDFGSGFSSFYYLRHLPIDVLKIDGSLVRDITHSPTDQHLVKAIVELSRGLGMKATAECVEDEATLVLLREYGVSFAQGFHIARPRPVREALGLLRPHEGGDNVA